jgi:cytochrome c oxidase subunit 1
MHYLGFIGVPRRYYEMYDSPYMTSGVGLNQFITVAALIVGFTQILFLYNLFTSWYKGEKSEKNPWKANSLEWHTPEMPPVHGNFGKELPVVYRWPYDFSVPGIDREYIPQHVPPSEVPTAKVEKT